METALDREPRPGQDQTKGRLQRDQGRPIAAADTGPEHLRPAQVGKGANASGHQLEAVLAAHGVAQGRLQRLRLGAGKVPKKMQRQVYPVDRVCANGVPQRLERIDDRLERVADLRRQLNGDEEPPAFAVSRLGQR